jgi:two-component system nitrate/nitrite response regulator NarL
LHVIDEIPNLVLRLGISLIRRAQRSGDNVGVDRTVLIVDDHAPFRRMARRLLEAGGFSVVGEAGDGASALAAAAALGPDVVLLDVLLPDMDGFAVARCLAERPGGAVVVLTSSRSALELGQRLEQAPAAGFIAKDALSAAALARFGEAQQ